MFSFLWDRKPTELRLLLVDMVTSCRVELKTTGTNHSLQQSVGSSYWSLLNFFGPTGLKSGEAPALFTAALGSLLFSWSHRTCVAGP